MASYVRKTPQVILDRLKDDFYKNRGSALRAVAKLIGPSEEEKDNLRAEVTRYFSPAAIKRRTARTIISRQAKKKEKSDNFPAFLRCAIAILNNEEIKAQVFDLLEHARSQNLSAGQLLDILAVA